ncbi:MAG: STAS domain-containing protein [Bacteroidetes bacterium]|nr:STAS domain-containing protein [Bacteroidota bacterium]MBL6944371.1 STAS domain-containing protein [Bacteroidales bacterium]
MEKIPILKFGDTLIVTIQTELHDRAANALQDDVLTNIQKYGSHAVIIDISSLEIVDSFIGRMLSNTAEMASLMNATVVLVGISPAVAITLVELGLDLGDVRTALDLENAIELLSESDTEYFKSIKTDKAINEEPQESESDELD